MRKLIKKILRESDDFEWARDIKINPWLEYDTIYFDIVPREEDVALYIELALSTRTINNSVFWSNDVREKDIESIIGYVHEGNCYLNISKYNNLSYGNESHYPKDTKKINYSTLIGKPLNEGDDWDWVRDITSWIPFEEAQIGEVYNIEKDEVLLDALNACGDYEGMYYDSVSAKVINKDHSMKYSDIYCGSENNDKVISVMLEFIDGNDDRIDTFWVAEDMVTLYPKI